MSSEEKELVALKNQLEELIDEKSEACLKVHELKKELDRLSIQEDKLDRLIGLVDQRIIDINRNRWGRAIRGESV